MPCCFVAVFKIALRPALINFVFWWRQSLVVASTILSFVVRLDVHGEISLATERLVTNIAGVGRV